MAGYMKTFTGKHIDPLHPVKEDIELRDIAHALSLICRGNGQTAHFYSVGQHCINCAKEAKERGYSLRVQLLCLLHDAAEAYMADLIRPVKQYMNGYQELENAFLQIVMQRFCLNDISAEEWELVKQIDDDLLVYDLVELLKEPMPEEGCHCCRIPDISFRPFEEVENEYYEMAQNYLGNIRKDN